MDQTNPPAPAQAPAPVKLPIANYKFPSSREIFKQTLAIYKKHAEPLIAISFAPFAVIFLGAFLLGAAGAVTMSSNGQISLSSGAGAIATLITAVIIIYFSVLSFAVFVHYIIAAIAGGEPISFKQAFENSYDDVLPLIGTGILAGLAVLGGLILLVVPGIIFGFWFSQAYYVVVAEKTGGRAALKQSKLYVKGNVGQIFKKGLYISLITAGLVLVAALIFGLLDGLLNTNLLAAAGGLILRIVLAPLVSIYTFLLFGYLKASKEKAL